jgi:hypothetical protein
MSIKYKKINFINKTDKKDNFFCDICNYILKSKHDFDTSKKYFCCHDCYLTFIESRIIDWEKGWRPSKTKIKEHIYNKDVINKTQRRILWH